MTGRARNIQSAKRVLEVGPGSGSFTRKILPALRDGDEFHIVEINAAFADHLERRFLAQHRHDHPKQTIRLHRAAIEHADIDGKFDLIVCGLPFNNFPLSLVRRIFSQMLELLKGDGELFFFEYAGVRPLKRALGSRASRAAMRKRIRLMQLLERRHLGRRRFILPNVPPAFAVSLKHARPVEASRSPSPSASPDGVNEPGTDVDPDNRGQRDAASGPKGQDRAGGTNAPGSAGPGIVEMLDPRSRPLDA
jgi:phospholipid N-methyltransferase